MSSDQPVPTLAVEWFRPRTTTAIVERTPTRPMIVVGSSQPTSILRPEAIGPSAPMLVRRRGGGGAVAIDPATTIWVDLWIPSQAPLFERGVVRGLLRVGDLFRGALHRLGATEISVVTRPRPQGGEIACFGGLGAGEIVDARGCKVLGMTAWRCRQGALFQCAGYVADSTNLLVGALDIDESARHDLGRALRAATALLADVVPPVGPERGLAVMRAQLVDALEATIREASPKTAVDRSLRPESLEADGLIDRTTP